MRMRAYVPAMILASWAGTYLDQVLVGMKLYTFPNRPFPEIFPYHILFTLVVLPMITTVYLCFMENMDRWGRGCTIVLLSFVMYTTEQISERMGWFVHTSEWRHSYSFIGYLLFLWLIWNFHRWINK